MREKLGLDDPLVVQYLNWLRGRDRRPRHIVRNGLRHLRRDRAATPTDADDHDRRTTGFGAARARPGNLLSGERQESAWWRRRRLLQIGVAIPTFWAGLLLVLVFGVRLGWLPTGGYVPFGDDPVECLRSIILPILALSLGITAVFTRYVRSR